jgi:hypothetical protein
VAAAGGEADDQVAAGVDFMNLFRTIFFLYLPGIMD